MNDHPASAPAPDDVGGTVAARIREALPGAEVEVAAASPGKLEAAVVSDQFEGLATIDRHRLVYAAVAPLIQSGAVHALSLATSTRAERDAKG